MQTLERDGYYAPRPGFTWKFARCCLRELCRCLLANEVPPPLRSGRGRGGTRLGRAVHAAIQSLPLDADEAMIEAFSRAQAVAEAIPDRSGEVARLVRQALQSDAAARARAAPRALREVSFAAEFDGVILEGFADLIIETADGIEIVDWKTDDIPAAAVRERLRQYELQAGLYVLGIESATGRPVTRVTYVFARAGLEESPGEPASLSARARAQLASVRT